MPTFQFEMHGCAAFARLSYAFQGEGSGRGVRSPNAY
jgi:hypothetical protein